MIRINLLAEKEDKSALYFIQLVVFAAALAVTCMGLFIYHDAEVASKKNLVSRKNTLQTQFTRLQRQTKEVENLEEKQRTLTDKLRTIALLKSRKRGPVHVLNEINLALPERSWLESIEQTGDSKLMIDGIALDDRTVANFVQGLEKSDYFSQIEILETKQTEIDEVKLRTFALSANVTSFILPEAQSAEGLAKSEETSSE